MQIGERLREAREAKQLSLEEIQEMTKIQTRYLVAIEQDDFHALPGKFYARAFIKEYAQAVGLDSTELLAGFDVEKIQTKEEEETVQYTRLNRSKRPGEAKGATVLSFLPTVIVVILIIGIVFVAWTLSQKSPSDSNELENDTNDEEIIRNTDEHKDSAQNEEENNDEAENNSEDVAEEEPEEEIGGTFSVVEEGTGGSPLSTMDFEYSGETVEVTFEVEETAYVALQNEDETYLQEGNLEPEASIEPIDVSGEDRIYFNIGNATGVTIIINGVTLEYPVDSNDFVHQKIWVNLNKAE